MRRGSGAPYGHVMSTRRRFVNGSIPTVLLVHGAFADGSHWAGVIAELQDFGIGVMAPANPLRGVAADAAYIAGVVAGIDGPVLLVGHAYGGAVITVAGAATDNVVGLVYVAAVATAEGESLLDIAGRFPDTLLGAALRPVPCATVNAEAGAELTLTPARYREVFAADLPEPVTSVAAVAQRPIAAAAFEQHATVAAWRTLPSWFVVATADHLIHPDAQRFMARRIGADTIEVDASHAVALSRPAEVARHIHAAAHASRATHDAVADPAARPSS
jgi:pimeloyl-ACP methyl ester carboxylesterase